MVKTRENEFRAIHRYARISAEKVRHVARLVTGMSANRALEALKPGDDMHVTVIDPDVVGNLRQLMGSLPGLNYDIKRIGEKFRILVAKKTIDDNDARS